MRKSIHVLMAAVLATSAVVSGCAGKSGAKGEEDKPLVVTMGLMYPPSEVGDEKGSPIGISVDSVKAFGESIGWEVWTENTAQDGLIPSLRTDKTDMVMSSVTITEERAKAVDFSSAYTDTILVVPTDKDPGITSVEDLSQPGIKVTTKAGSIGHIYTDSDLSNAEIITLSDGSVCVTEVVQGKADGFIYDQLTTYRSWQKNIDMTAAIFIPFQDVGKWGIAVQKGNTELLDQLNTFIKEYTENGSFDELTERYLLKEKEAFEGLSFKWSFDLS